MKKGSGTERQPCKMENKSRDYVSLECINLENGQNLSR